MASKFSFYYYRVPHVENGTLCFEEDKFPVVGGVAKLPREIGDGAHMEPETDGGKIAAFDAAVSPKAPKPAQPAGQTAPAEKRLKDKTKAELIADCTAKGIALTGTETNAALMALLTAPAAEKATAEPVPATPTV